MATIAGEADDFRAAPAAEGVRAEAGSIAAMDGLRGVSVAWIVLFHFVVLRDPALDPWAAFLGSAPGLSAAIARGPFAVDLFFLLSGFLLTLPWIIRAREGRPAPRARGFYARRVLRIVPAYYVHVLLLFLVVMPLLHGATYWRSDLYVYALNAVAHGLFLHNATPLTSGSLGVNGALWTLAVEAQFYALLPLMAPIFVRAPWRSLAAAAAISAAWVAGVHAGFDALVRSYAALGSHWSWREDSIRTLLGMQLPAYLVHFALGAMLARAWLRGRGVWPEWAPAGLFALCTAMLALVASGAWNPFGAHAWLATLAALGGIVLAAASDRVFARTILGRGPAAFLGRISYSAYLWHLPLMLLLQSRLPTAGEWFFPVYAASVVGVGWISWRWIERPFMRASPRASAGPR